MAKSRAWKRVIPLPGSELKPLPKKGTKKVPQDLRGKCLHDGRKQKQPMAYWAYLRTSHWSIVREKAVAILGTTCTNCGSTYRINVHHLTYDNLWHEYVNDLTVLCEPCHHLLHGRGL
jgi:5-methylcytosine-specific restriction endonuclease McrA